MITKDDIKVQRKTYKERCRPDQVDKNDDPMPDCTMVIASLTFYATVGVTQLAEMEYGEIALRDAENKARAQILHKIYGDLYALLIEAMQQALRECDPTRRPHNSRETLQFKFENILKMVNPGYILRIPPQT